MDDETLDDKRCQQCVDVVMMFRRRGRGRRWLFVAPARERGLEGEAADEGSGFVEGVPYKRNLESKQIGAFEWKAAPEFFNQTSLTFSRHIIITTKGQRRDRQSHHVVVVVFFLIDIGVF